MRVARVKLPPVAHQIDGTCTAQGDINGLQESFGGYG